MHPDQIAATLNRIQNDLGILIGRGERTTQKVYRNEALARLAAAGRKPTLPISFRGQYWEDLFIWDAFDGAIDGFYIEAGAFDGHTFSVTYALEAVGWKGLLVEAIPERAEQCRVNRAGSRVVHAALGPRSAIGTLDFTIVEDQFGGMFSYSKPTHQHLQSLDPLGFPRRKVSVPLTSLDELLKDHAGPIDVAMIDVEGAELDVLNGFDLARHKPRMLLLEDNSVGRDPMLQNYMQSQPYTFIGWVAVNRVYVQNEQAALMERAKSTI